jgi:hypothetical protein
MDSHTTKKRKVVHSDGSYRADGQTTYIDTDGQKQGPRLVKDHANRNTISQDGQLLVGEMYKSSMFKLQLDELLDEVQPRYERRMVPVENALRKLKSVIERVPDREPVDVCNPLSKDERDTLMVSFRLLKRRKIYINGTRSRFRSRILRLQNMPSTSWHTRGRQI